MRTAISVGDYLLDSGFTPFIPHLTGIWDLLFPHDYETWMKYDEEWLKSCDAVLRLSGQSNGADREVKRANELAIPVFYDTEMLKNYFDM